MRQQKHELAPYLFHSGTNYRAYEYLGVHRKTDEFVFRVWAPRASAAFALGDFNSWSESLPMTRITPGGIWECSMRSDIFGRGSAYKFKLNIDGQEIYRSDPYAAQIDTSSYGTSRFFEKSYEWNDETWLRHRADKQNSALNIYELHWDSWYKNESGSCLSYREAAPLVASYVKSMGYTHVALLPIAERDHGDLSGYRSAGLYAPHSQFGDPDELCAFVDILHRSGVGVILDWVPFCFSKSEKGLSLFDGSALYEVRGNSAVKNGDFLKFDIERDEVRSFLVSNAIYWINEFHFDGLRVCRPRELTDQRRIEARVLDTVTAELSKTAPGAVLLNNENTVWMDKSSEYASMPIDLRAENQKIICDAVDAAAKNPHKLLSVPHGRVSGGYGSFIGKMPGSCDERFAGARLFSTLALLCPGGKLTFMGQEIGQFDEWNSNSTLNRELSERENHSSFKRFFAEANRMYAANPTLHGDDLEWLLKDNVTLPGIIAFCRKKDGCEPIIALFNFTAVAHTGLELPVPEAGRYREIFNSDRTEFGGGGTNNSGISASIAQKNKNIMIVNLPPLGCAIFKKI